MSPPVETQNQLPNGPNSGQYRAPALPPAEDSGERTTSAFPHPSNTEEAVLESTNIELDADAALHSGDSKAIAAEFQRIEDSLKSMSPAERALMYKQFQKIGDAIPDNGLRIVGRSTLPDITINRDKSGNVTDITFKSLSDDDAYGMSYNIELTDESESIVKETKSVPDGNNVLLNEHGDRYTLDAAGQITSYKYVDNDGEVEKGFLLGRDNKGNINQIIDEQGNVFRKLPKDATSSDLNIRYGVGWAKHTNTGLRIGNSHPIGFVTAGADVGIQIHLPGGPSLEYAGRAALGIAELKRNDQAE